jgi:nitrate/TMAO reductase-like tetraheme cytochrome c subunit
MAMRAKRWVLVLGLLAIGGVAGAGAMLVSLEVNRGTSTEAFCTSCHSMTNVAADMHYRQSAHRANAEGVRAGCADCHIPKTNWFVETYTHVAAGVRDVIAEHTHDFADPKVWEARRAALAHEVRDTMRQQDSVTCRACHAGADVEPVSERGRAAHALLRDRRMTCIDCHFKLVYAPTPPTIEFIRGAGLGGAGEVNGGGRDGP